MGNSNAERHEFRTETKQLLDIVIHSLYTDKEVFLRELVSNASDALEKLRYLQLTEKDIFDENLPLEIEVRTDQDKNTVTVIDYGVGMTKEELIKNLGTIAHSGSKKFIESVSKGEKIDQNLIGQFGVGFYSVFMVARLVEVYTHGWRKDDEHLLWRSDGTGWYEIERTTGLRRGTKVVVHLKEEEKDFADPQRVRQILDRYSRFVQFPLKLNGEQINKVEAIWLKNKSEVTPEEYVEFYRFHSNLMDEPTYVFHMKSDAPIEINALLFVPGNNPEIAGLGKIDPGVSLYCKKILIDSSPKGLLPEWLRFLRGVVDSADIPLNISRESMQDSRLLQGIGKAITGRFIKFLEDEQKANPEKYDKFFKEFGLFLKEGAATDHAYRDQLINLLRFESSRKEKDKYVSLKDYVSSMKEGQKFIYYIYGESREAAENSPHIEAFRKGDVEVLYFYHPVDEFIMGALGEYEGKKIVSVDSADLDMDISLDKDSEDSLSDAEAKELCEWVKEKLGERVENVSVSKRLVDSPAVVLNADTMMTKSMRRVMKAMNKDIYLRPKLILEINTAHPLIKNLSSLKNKDEEVATLITEQIYDNALLSAGYMEDPRSMTGRIYDLLERLSAG